MTQETISQDDINTQMVDTLENVTPNLNKKYWYDINKNLAL